MIQFHQDGTRPSKDQIFVFGSNEAGVHGAGAAAFALELGAVWGQGHGIHGSTYAIPTKDHDIETLRLSIITMYVNLFIQFTKDNPNLKFFVTRVGCGLAGYTDNQIAPLFKGAVNCSFAEEWKPYL